MNQYEAMFLFEPNFASDFSKAKQEVERILSRAGAEVVFLEKWDERKLAYEIKGHKRGCYVLCYFRCDPAKVGGIERDARISEPILRVLVLRADDITLERMQTFIQQHRAGADSGDADDFQDDGDYGSRRRSPRPRSRFQDQPASVAVAEKPDTDSEKKPHRKQDETDESDNDATDD